MLYAFDILVDGGDDLRKLPLHLRKNNLSRLFARRVDGIFLSDFEQGEIGPDLYPACLPDGSGRPGLETSRSPVSSWPIAALGQGEEPKSSGNGEGQGVLVMTTIAKLLAEKQRLLERLQEDPGPHEREEIERLLAEIDAALNQLDE